MRPGSILFHGLPGRPWPVRPGAGPGGRNTGQTLPVWLSHVPSAPAADWSTLHPLAFFYRRTPSSPPSRRVRESGEPHARTNDCQRCFSCHVFSVFFCASSLANNSFSIRVSFSPDFICFALGFFFLTPKLPRFSFVYFRPPAPSSRSAILVSHAIRSEVWKAYGQAAADPSFFGFHNRRAEWNRGSEYLLRFARGGGHHSLPSRDEESTPHSRVLALYAPKKPFYNRAAGSVCRCLGSRAVAGGSGGARGALRPRAGRPPRPRRPRLLRRPPLQLSPCGSADPVTRCLLLLDSATHSVFCILCIF